MSFSKTVSVFAALASIFAAAATGYKLAQDNEAKPPEPTDQTSNYEQNINQLQQEIADLDRKSTRLNSSHSQQSRMPSSA